MAQIGICQASPEWRRFVCDTEFRLNTKRACGWLRNERTILRGLRWRAAITCIMVLGRMGIWPLDLNEALRADGLVAATCLIEIGRIVEEANRAFGRVFVQKGFNTLAVDIGVFGELYLLRRHI